MELRLDKVDGPLIARIEIATSKDWSIVNSLLSEVPSGIHNIVVLLNESNSVEIDWISFQ